MLWTSKVPPGGEDGLDSGDLNLTFPSLVYVIVYYHIQFGIQYFKGLTVHGLARETSLRIGGSVLHCLCSPSELGFGNLGCAAAEIENRSPISCVHIDINTLP